MPDIPADVWKAGLANQDARAAKADAEASRMAKESRKAYLADQAAEMRAEQEGRMRVADAARDPGRITAERAAARHELGMAQTRSRQVDPADLAARLAAAEETAKAARTAFDIVTVRAQAAQVRAVNEAGVDPVARAKAGAKAQSDWAEAVGAAEAEWEAASFEADRAAVATAEVAKIVAHRVNAAKARMEERAKAEADPLRTSNPYIDPLRPVITQSQFDAIRDPALRARAAKEAQVIPDDDPPFTKADVEALLRARGSLGRVVLTRAELAKLSPQDQARAAKTAIICDA